MRKFKMRMKNENAVIHGAGGSVGAAVARAFAYESTKGFLTRCHLTSVHNKFAKNILFVGGVAEASDVDALDAQSVDVQI
jgi:NAD(P)-dependent dehydrogenase (short-subunit alcohol dehydrogenase family)